jgi:hypothetical protein
MQNCSQTDTQSVYEHGIAVKNYTFKLIDILEGKSSPDGFKLPNWCLEFRHNLLKNLLPKDIIEEYTIFHDCGKPYCMIVDENGKRHFPNHAEKSRQTWLSLGGSPTVANLIGMDMMIHTMKSNEIDEFIKHKEAITLLIVGLAEIHANAEMFGGIDSTSFKIKLKQINKKGEQICQKLFKEIDHVVD